MHTLKRITAALCALLISITPAHAAQTADGYVGSRPDAQVYCTQTRKHTCTLIAATMMLRNYTRLNGHAYELIDEWSVGGCAWSSWGLAKHFAVGTIEVCSDYGIKDATDKKRYLIDTLAEHPEGVVIYDTGAPHAIFLFGYDPVMDTFYCADTIVSRGGRPIRLEQSIIRGEDQAAKVATIDKLWYVAGTIDWETEWDA